MSEKSDLTLVCEAITAKAREGVVFEASDLVLPKVVSSQVKGNAFRILRKSLKNPNGIIVRLPPTQSEGVDRNGSLVYRWKGV